MIQEQRAPSPPPDPAAAERRQVSRAVIACFLVSGLVGLVYQVLWIRLLGLVFGHTVFAVTTVLAAFMGGLGLGSFLFGRLADRSRHCLALYGLLEIGIGLYCLLLPWLLDGAGALYLWIGRGLATSYLGFSALQFCLVALLLVPPTTLMGGTLPLLVRFFVRDAPTLGRQVGLLYAVNTGGAVLGALLAGYVLVPDLGIRTTILLAVVTNVGVGALVLVFDRHLARLGGSGRPAEAPGARPAPPPAPAWEPRVVAAAFAVSGAASMIYEVTWSRALALVIGSSTYAFTAMLVAFLTGIALGSFLFALCLGRRQAGPAAFGALQLAIGLCGLGLIPLFGRLPVLFLGLMGISQGPAFTQGVQFGISVALMLLPTLFIGATFPCAVRIVATDVGRAGFDTGWLYTVNTLGCIAGTLVAGFLAIPLLGVQGTMRLAVAVNLTVGALLCLPTPAAGRRAARAAAVGIAALGVLAGSLLPPWNPILMASGVAIYASQYAAMSRAGAFARGEWQPEVLYYRDGISATVSVHRNGPGLSLRVNGKTDAGNTRDMHTQLLLGHLPLLIHPGAKRVLIIGLGSGVTAGAVAQHPVERIDIVEIEPAVAEAARYFEAENRRVLADPRVHLIVADGRNFLRSAETPYDVIISEPSNPWIRGLATLFTREFFALAQSRLAPGGMMLQWLQGYGIAPEDLRMVVRTYRTAFPHTSLWYSSVSDYFLLGTAGPLRLSLQGIRQRLERLPRLQEDFVRMGLFSAPGLLANFLLGEEEAARFAGEGELNLDDTLRLEFTTPLSLYESQLTDHNYRLLQSYRGRPVPPLSREELAWAESAEGRYARALALGGKEFPGEAEVEFARALAADPHHLGSRLELARLLAGRGMALRALRLLEEIPARSPLEAQSQFVRGLAYAQQGLAAEARAALARAAALAPENREVRLRLAGLYRGEGSLEAARAIYAALHRARPDDLEAALALAEVDLARREPAAAGAVLRPLLANLGRYPIPGRSRIYHLLGAAHLAAGEVAEAVAALTRATRLAPLEAPAWLDLSRALEGAGDLEGAQEALARLLAMHPNHLEAERRLQALAERR